MTIAPRRKKKVVVFGNFLFQGTEVPICHLDLGSQDMSCLPGSHIQDVTERLPELIHVSEHNPSPVCPFRHQQY